MFNKVFLSFLIVLTFGCHELQPLVNQVLQNATGPSNEQISLGLKEALQLGVESGVTDLHKKNGFLNNQAVKILFPKEFQKVENTLRKVGLNSLADKGVEVLNRAAEDAVTEASPIFINAIKGISFNDLMGILKGNDNAATSFLQNKTQTQLFSAFKPKVTASMQKVGADKIWATLINKYNTIPLVQKVNPDLSSYTTEKTIEGLFTMISKKEKGIRTDVGQRKTALLQKVFALQD